MQQKNNIFCSLLSSKAFPVVGCSTLTIRETQQREWLVDGSLKVTSEPVLDIVGGSKFTTSAEFTMQSSADQSGCEVRPLATYTI